MIYETNLFNDIIDTKVQWVTKVIPNNDKGFMNLKPELKDQLWRHTIALRRREDVGLKYIFY